jgi:hypothetical protein
MVNAHTPYRIKERQRLQSKQWQRRKRELAILGTTALSLSEVHDLYAELREEFNVPLDSPNDAILNSVIDDREPDPVELFWLYWEPTSDSVQRHQPHAPLHHTEATTLLRMRQVFLRNEINEAEDRLLEVKCLVSCESSIYHQTELRNALIKKWRIDLSPIEAKRRRFKKIPVDETPEGSFYAQAAKLTARWLTQSVLNRLQAIIALEEGVNHFMEEASQGKLRGFPTGLIL